MSRSSLPMVPYSLRAHQSSAGTPALRVSTAKKVPAPAAKVLLARNSRGYSSNPARAAISMLGLPARFRFRREETSPASLFTSVQTPLSQEDRAEAACTTSAVGFIDHP